MMRDYLSPERQRVALLTIAAQRDFCLPNSPAKVGGSMAAVPPMVRLVEGFRQRGRPIIHVVRLYRCDGSNVELCNRASIEEGQRIVMPGTLGAELMDGLKPDQEERLDCAQLLEGRLQELGRHEWIMYKPRWSAFFRRSSRSIFTAWESPPWSSRAAVSPTARWQPFMRPAIAIFASCWRPMPFRGRTTSAWPSSPASAF